MISKNGVFPILAYFYLHTLSWDKDKNLHKMLKVQQVFPKLYRCLLYDVFHNLELQNAGLVDVKKDLN